MNRMNEKTDASIPPIAWMRRLAGELVADAGLADDLVQDAWVQFLTHPPEPSGSINAWFKQVMRNLARHHWRRDRQRVEVEFDRHEDRSTEATVELVARARAQQALVDQVLALETDYRDVLMLRYFEELESPAIAERLGIGASTVRTRLQRGRQMLRARLEARHGPTAKDWLPAIVPLLPRPVGLDPGLVAPSAPTTLILPVGSMGFAALVLMALSAVIYFNRDLMVRNAPLEGPEQVAAVAGGMTSPPLVAPRVEGPMDSPSDRVPAERSVAKEGHVEELVESPASQLELLPATRVQILVDQSTATLGSAYLNSNGRWIVDDRDGGESEQRRAAVDAKGLAQFEDASFPSGAVGYAPYPGATVLQRNFRRPDPQEMILLQVGTARIEGRVLDEKGTPLPGTVVDLGMKIGWDYGALRARVTTDVAGRFSIDGLPAGDFWLHTDLQGSGGSMRFHGEFSAGEIREVTLGDPAGRVQLSGWIVDESGQPVVVFEPPTLRKLLFARSDDSADRKYFPARLGADGSFDVQLPPGEYSVRRTIGRDASSQLLSSNVSIRESGEQNLVLRGARLGGVASVADSGVPFDPETDGHAVVRLVQEGEGGRKLRYESVVGAGGHYAFAGLGAGSWVLSCTRLAEPGARDVLLIPSDRERQIDLVLE